MHCFMGEKRSWDFYSWITGYGGQSDLSGHLAPGHMECGSLPPHTSKHLLRGACRAGRQHMSLSGSFPGSRPNPAGPASDSQFSENAETTWWPQPSLFTQCLGTARTQGFYISIPRSRGLWNHKVYSSAAELWNNQGPLRPGILGSLRLPAAAPAFRFPAGSGCVRVGVCTPPDASSPSAWHDLMPDMLI